MGLYAYFMVFIQKFFKAANLKNSCFKTEVKRGVYRLVKPYAEDFFQRKSYGAGVAEGCNRLPIMRARPMHQAREAVQPASTSEGKWTPR